MTDTAESLTKELREWTKPNNAGYSFPIATRAADLITSIQADNERMREALTEIADVLTKMTTTEEWPLERLAARLARLATIARTALSPPSHREAERPERKV